MKKLLILLLACMLALTVFVACTPTGTGTETPSGDEQPTTDTPIADEGLQAAVDYIHQMYKDMAVETGANYDLVTKIAIGDVTYTVTWTVSSDKIQVVPVEGKDIVTITVPENSKEEIAYTLTATITNDKGETATKSYEHKVPQFKVLSYDEYYKTEAGKAVVVEGTVVAVHSQSAGNKYNQLYLMDASGKGGYYIYSISNKVDPAKDLGIKMGMTVTVTGTKDIYSGTHEVKDATVAVTDKTVKDITPVDITETFKNAKDLTDANLVNKLGMLVTIKGVEITDQDLSEKSMYFNFKLGNNTSYIRVYTTDCPVGVGGEGGRDAIISGHTDHKGWKADVTGVVVLYNGAIYLNPVTKNCFTYLEEIERTPAEKLAIEKENLEIKSEILVNRTLELPTAGSIYSDVAITWASDNKCAVVNGNKLIVTLQDKEQTVKLTATLKCGDKTEKVELTMKVVARPTKIPATVTKADDIVAGTAYKFYFIHLDKGYLYITGNMANTHYFETTTDLSKGLDVKVEKVAGGYKLKTTIDKTDKYINIVQSGKYTNVKYEDAGTTVYTFDETLKTFTVKFGEDTYAVGVSGNYDTAQPVKITDKNIYVAQIGTVIEVAACKHDKALACATVCPDCGATITAKGAHEYEVPCAMTCKVCGATRTDKVTHEYLGACYAECKNCGETTRTAGDHTYANACDATCDVCGETRTPGAHVDADNSGACDNCNKEMPKVPTTPEEIVDAAWALGNGETLGEQTLTGLITSVDTPYSTQFKNITVTIVVAGKTDKPIVCYRLNGVGCETLVAGDTITVTGELLNHVAEGAETGTIEFSKPVLDEVTYHTHTYNTLPAKCDLCGAVKDDHTDCVDADSNKVCDQCGADLRDLTPTQILDEAYALESGVSFEKSYTLSGVIISIEEFNTQYNNVNFTIKVDGDEKGRTIYCYGIGGEGADLIAKGDSVTVSGIIKNYSGTIEYDKGSTLDSYTKHTEHVYTTYTAKCDICDAIKADHTTCTDADSDGYCDACHEFVKVLTYVKVTDDTEIEVGDKIIFVNETNSVQLSSWNTVGNHYGKTETYETKPSNKAMILEVVEGTTGGTFGLMTEDGKYLAWRSGNTLTTEDTQSDYSDWLISFDEEGNALIENSMCGDGEAGRFIRYNEGSPRFATYKGDSRVTGTVQIYKISE